MARTLETRLGLWHMFIKQNKLPSLIGWLVRDKMTKQVLMTRLRPFLHFTATWEANTQLGTLRSKSFKAADRQRTLTGRL